MVTGERLSCYVFPSHSWKDQQPQSQDWGQSSLFLPSKFAKNMQHTQHSSGPCSAGGFNSFVAPQSLMLTSSLLSLFLTQETFVCGCGKASPV